MSLNREQCTQTQYDRRVLGDPFQRNPLSLAWRRCMSKNFHCRRRIKFTLKNVCNLIFKDFVQVAM